MYSWSLDELTNDDLETWSKGNKRRVLVRRNELFEDLIDWTKREELVGDTVEINNVDCTIDGFGSTFSKGGTTACYCYLIVPEDADPDTPEGAQWFRARSGSVHEGDFAKREGKWWVATGDVSYTCNECGGRLDHRNAKCRCGLTPAGGIGVSMSFAARPATSEEVVQVESEIRQRKIRKVGKAARQNHAESLFRSKIADLDDDYTLWKTDNSPSYYADYDIDVGETVAKLKKGHDVRKIRRLTVDGREAWKYTFGNRAIYYLPEDIYHDAVIGWAKERAVTVKGARQWLDGRDTRVVGIDDYFYVASLEDDGECADQLRKAARLNEALEMIDDAWPSTFSSDAKRVDSLPESDRQYRLSDKEDELVVLTDEGAYLQLHHRTTFCPWSDLELHRDTLVELCEQLHTEYS